MFYSGSLTFFGATPLTVKAGQSMDNLVVTIKKTAARRLAGRIAIPPRATAFCRSNMRRKPGQVPKASIPVRSDGTFSREWLAPVRYTLTLNEDGRKIAERQVDLTDGDATGIVLERLEPMDVKATIRTEGTGPAFQPPPLFGPFLVEVGGDHEVSGRLQPDGTYEFRGVTPRIYRFVVSLNGQNLYLKQITLGGEVQAGKNVDLRSGKPGVMEVILSHNVAQVEGHVAGPKAHAYESEETTVILVPEVAAGEELPIAAQAAADEKGHFKLEALPPGKYRLFAIQGFDEDDWGSPQLATELAGKAVKLELTESEKKSVTITVISSEEWEAAVKKVGSRP